jgi:hypothetical protein
MDQTRVKGHGRAIGQFLLFRRSMAGSDWAIESERYTDTQPVKTEKTE